MNPVLYQHCGQQSRAEMEEKDDSDLVGRLRPGETLVQQMERFFIAPFLRHDEHCSI